MVSQNNADMDIANLIMKNPSEDYEELLGTVEDWQTFYQLSAMRKGLFYWYDFEPDSVLLEIGAGFGALTGLFCDRCKSVVAVEKNGFRAKYLKERYHNRANLTVYHGEVEQAAFSECFPEKFDYIILTGLLETQLAGSVCREQYANYLKSLASRMKPSGHLFLAVDNRYGIRYFCGAPETHTGRPFDGINRYPFGTSGHSFSRQEFVDILEMAGLAYKFYYPLPDYKLPQLIYSDAYIQGSSIRERLMPYYTDSSSLVAYEKHLYEDLMENKVLHFFANSFLAECTVSGRFGPVIYAALSVDRGKEHGFATTLREDGRVEKICLEKEGQESLRQIARNIQQLKEHGVNTVEHVWAGKRLSMPYIKAPTLSNQLQACYAQDAQAFFQLFDLLYESILRSSEHVPQEENCLQKKGNGGVAYGPVLKKAYLDMVPINCFYIQGNLYFFDQEFVKEHYPAGYVLYRAIFYTYMYMPQIESWIPMEKLKERYQLTEAWQMYEKEEQEFIASNRNMKIYGQFYQWAQVDIQRIYDKIKEKTK